MEPTMILVADDEPHVTRMLSQRLMNEGYAVLIANDGLEAFRLANAHHPRLVITDFQMPSMSGLELAMKLRERLETTNIPVMMLTARGHRISSEELAKTNIKHLLGKPFSLREVVCKAAELLGHSKPVRSEDAAANDAGAIAA